MFKKKCRQHRNGVIQQGVQQRNSEIAKSLLADNVPIEIISKHTGISVEELGKIK
jgi:hypothetical protein